MVGYFRGRDHSAEADVLAIAAVMAGLPQAAKAQTWLEKETVEIQKSLARDQGVQKRKYKVKYKLLKFQNFV